MNPENNVAHYITLIKQAQSYQDLVFFRNRMFEVMERMLTRDEVEAVKQAWTERAKDENLPVVPTGQKKTATLE